MSMARMLFCAQVCLPVGGDQIFNARRWAELGTSIALADTATHDDIIQAVSDVLVDTGYRRAAEQLQAEIRGLPSLTRPCLRWNNCAFDRMHDRSDFHTQKSENNSSFGNIHTSGIVEPSALKY